jgi:hypothetical protein
MEDVPVTVSLCRGLGEVGLHADEDNVCAGQLSFHLIVLKRLLPPELLTNPPTCIYYERVQVENQVTQDSSKPSRRDAGPEVAFYRLVSLYVALRNGVCLAVASMSSECLTVELPETHNLAKE